MTSRQSILFVKPLSFPFPLIEPTTSVKLFLKPKSVHGTMAMVHCACKSSSRIGSWDDGRGALLLPPPVLCTLPPWRLVLLEGRGASEASYPAWSAAETSRPKVLVFLLPKLSLDDGRGALRLQIFIPKRSLSKGNAALRLPPPVLRTLPPWRLVLLEGRGASEASYPAWSAAETSRPKVLVFLHCGDCCRA